MKTTAELEARIAEWVIKEIDKWSGSVKKISTELRARAFPPKFEEVEVNRWECPFCTMSYHTDPYTTVPQILLLNDCCNKARVQGVFIILTGHYHRPIVAKVKHREQIEPVGGFYWFNGDKAESMAQGTKFYAEWEAAT